MTTPKPCACAPGCRNNRTHIRSLCESCWDEWRKSHAYQRHMSESGDDRVMRHLADWARTRGRELENGGKA